MDTLDTQSVTRGAAIRASTTIAVVGVAAFAAIQSFSHIYWLGRTHGQSHLDSSLLPLSVDGLILAASLVMLHESRTGRGSPALARLALWLGIAVTVAANVGYGLPYGPIGALVSAWPALAFVIAVEMLMGLIRRTRKPAVKPSARPSVAAIQKPPAARTRKAARKPSDADRAARLRALLDAGETVTIDRAMAELKAGRPVAKRALAMAVNGNEKART